MDVSGQFQRPASIPPARDPPGPNQQAPDILKIQVSYPCRKSNHDSSVVLVSVATALPRFMVLDLCQL